jgi:hypothetical protein
LLEVVVGGESVGDPRLTHQVEADGVTERVGFIELLSQQLHPVLVEDIINPDDSQVGDARQGIREGQGTAANPRSIVGEGNELGEHVVVRQGPGRGLEQRSRVGVAPFGSMKEAEEAGSVQEHHGSS